MCIQNYFFFAKKCFYKPYIWMVSSYDKWSQSKNSNSICLQRHCGKYHMSIWLLFVPNELIQFAFSICLFRLMYLVAHRFGFENCQFDNIEPHCMVLLNHCIDFDFFFEALYESSIKIEIFMVWLSVCQI